MSKNQKIRKFAFFAAIACLLLFSACAKTETTLNTSPIRNETQIIKSEGNIKKFSSYEELEDFVKTSAQIAYSGHAEKGIAIEELSAAPSPALSEAAKGAAGALESQTGAESSYADISYSETNVQVKGVDEADIVKTDGKYIYAISGKKVVIVLAYLAEEAKVVSQIEFESSPEEIFVNKANDKLVVFLRSYEKFAKTIIKIYDISDKSKPELEHSIEATGNYFDSRMIDSYVYAIIQQPVFYKNKHILLPEVKFDDSRHRIEAESIYYFGYPDYGYNFVVVFAFDLKTGKAANKTFLIGNQQRIYVSEDNIYFLGDKRADIRNFSKRVYEEAILPLLSGEAREEAEKIAELKFIDEIEKRSLIERIFRKYLESIDPEEAAEKMKAYAEKINEISMDFEKTRIYKISIDKLNISYVAGAEVRGRVLDQFSMHEYGDYFRIATTSFSAFFMPEPRIMLEARESMPEVMPRSESSNNVYVLDNNLNIIGKLENIAKGEQIYAARFLGDKLFLVTFRRVDPFFVIDLSNPEKPEILGYLKIPGFSEYFHVYDEKHILGIGREVDESTGRLTGIKISLFDISNFSKPEEKAKFVIESRYSSSEALFDHKAVLFSKDKALLVIPVSEQELIPMPLESGEGAAEIEKPIPRKPRFWQGAYVFSVNENEILLKGKITHFENKSMPFYALNIRRALYIDNVLYTVSQAMIKANALEDLEEIKKISLPFEEEPIFRIMG